MKRGWMIFKMVTLGLIAIAVFTWLTMLLWNWLVPAVFNGPLLNYWQTLGLLVLSKILFSGFGRKHGGGHWKQGGYWRSHFYKKIASMSPEEREAFKSRMKEKWGCRPAGEASEPATGSSESRSESDSHQ